MKNRVYFHTIILLTYIIFILASCKDDPPGISVSVDQITLDALPVEPSIIDISANVAWSATIGDEGWLSVDPLSGNGSVAMSLTAQENTTSDERVTSIILSGDGVPSDTVTVIQMPGVDVAEEIVDDTFREYCLVNFDTDGDGKLSQGEARAVKEINVFDYIEEYPDVAMITSLEGIEYFTALETLDCKYNEIEELDISKNTSLVDLDCSRNQLTTIDISENKKLTWLSCSGNQFAKLDVSNNTELLILDCNDNKLTELDIRQLSGLMSLSCSSNQLTHIDVSKNTKLVNFYCGNNQLANIDLNMNTVLRQFLCTANKFTIIDISNNKNLEILNCQGNNSLTTIYVWAGFNQKNPNFYKDDLAKYVEK